MRQESISYSERKTTADRRPLISSGIDIQRAATLGDTAGQEVHFEDEHTGRGKKKKTPKLMLGVARNGVKHKQTRQPQCHSLLYFSWSYSHKSGRYETHMEANTIHPMDGCAAECPPGGRNRDLVGGKKLRRETMAHKSNAVLRASVMGARKVPVHLLEITVKARARNRRRGRGASSLCKPNLRDTSPAARTARYVGPCSPGES